MTRRPIVFLGPSLPHSEAVALLDAEFRPPVAQGDLLRALREAPPAIAIIDGVFRNEPTVRHRECLWVMSRGVPLFGASSMGALRAAELHPQGMIGVGLIFRWYRRFALLADDAVALTHGPATLGSPPLSDALVDIRTSLRRAVRAGAVAPAAARAMAQRAARIPFSERSLTRLGTLAGMPELDATLAAHHFSQKAEDARTLLQRLARHQQDGSWPLPETRPPAPVHAWIDDLRDSGFEVQLDPAAPGGLRIHWP